MKLLCLAAVLAFTASLDATASTYELAAVITPESNPNQLDVELRFTAPEGAEVRVTAGGTTVSRTSTGFKNAKLSFKLDKDRSDGTKNLTFLVGFGSAPDTGLGGKVDNDTTLDLKLTITKEPTSVPHGTPVTIGKFNGKPVTLFVKPIPAKL